MLSIPHQLVGVPLGYAVTLECHTEAHPTSLNYWTREDGLMIHENKKYKVTSTPEKPPYKTNMTLTIFDIQVSVLILHPKVYQYAAKYLFYNKQEISYFQGRQYSYLLNHLSFIILENVIKN